jgi:hypothetical protein
MCQRSPGARPAGIPDFSALSDLFAGAPGKLPEVPRDLLPVAGELRRVLAPFFEASGESQGTEQVESTRVSWRI